MKQLVFDIETIRNPAMIDMLPEPKADTRLRDPIKIAADIAKKKESQIELMGLDPTQNLICTIGMLDLGETTPTILTLNPETLNEKELLEWFWEACQGYGQFITFNGMNFDIPTIKFHSMVHQVPMTVKFSEVRYRINNHVDVRMILGNWDKHAKGTQDYFCKILLGEGKPDGIDGSMVQELWDKGEYHQIADYCADDVEKLAELYKRMVGYYV